MTFDAQRSSRPATIVREAGEEYWPSIWPIVEEVVRAADTFATLGVAPGAFRHPELGDVGLRIMWRELREPSAQAAPGEAGARCGTP